MRDPMNWALPVFRAFGIPVKVHIFFFVVTFGLFLRELTLPWMKDVWWVDIFLLTIVVLFGVILLHEFGHCFGARFVDGDAKEVLIWPLGGLAFVDVPHTPRAHFIAAAAGPAMNIVICFVCAVLMSLAGFLPSLNPFIDPYRAEIAKFNGRTYTSSYSHKYYMIGTNKEVITPNLDPEEAQARGVERALAPIWVVWLYRIFWLSWILFLFNLLPAYPLDGGRLLQCVIWARTDYRRGVVVAAYSGFVVSVLFLLLSIAKDESLLMGLALFMMYEASLALYQLETEDGPFGYDFSAGYTSLEKDEEKPKKQKKVGWFTRWRQARRARRLQREAEERQRDEERMDQLLEKIARSGKESLTDEEKRFLERVSARKRNMS